MRDNDREKERKKEKCGQTNITCKASNCNLDLSPLRRSKSCVQRKLFFIIIINYFFSDKNVT